MRVFKWSLAGVAAVAVAAFLVVTALGSGVLQAQEGDKGVRGRPFMEALANRLGISVEELQAKRQAALDDVLKKAVEEGRLTQEQADKIREHPFRAAAGARKAAHAFAVNVMEAAAKTLNMTTDELRTALKGGKSLSTIAAERGVDKSNLKAGITNEVNKQLDQAVADGKLTREQANTIATNFQNKLDQMLDRTGPGDRGMPPFRGPRP